MECLPAVVRVFALGRRRCGREDAHVRSATAPLHVLSVCVLVAGLIGMNGPASAACVPPTVEYDTGPVDRGGPVNVRGSHFGDDCYDAGSPPPGVGPLGDPVEDIVVSVVQGDRSVIVAKGSADRQYTFDVTFSLPSALAPGEATITVSSPTGFVMDVTDAPLTVSDALAPVTDTTIETFGPVEVTPPPATGQVPADTSRNIRQTRSDSSIDQIAVVAALTLGVIAATTVLRRRQSTTHT